ncbi:hypothetical protein HDV04_002532, partial [Boothiomyces sp. JEL0838]
MQSNCQFAVYTHDLQTTFSSSYSSGQKSSCFLAAQTNGQLVIYQNSDGTARPVSVLSSVPANPSTSYLLSFDSVGNLTWTDDSGQLLWSSNGKFSELPLSANSPNSNPQVLENSTISANNQDSFSDPLFNNFITEKAGLITLFAFALFLMISFIIILLVRFMKARGKMDPIHAGALRYSAAQGNIPALELIAQQPNFDVNSNHDGFTALHAASVTGQAKAVQWLLEKGANVSLKKNDDWNDTALHYAAAKGHADVVLLLLQYGAPLEKNFAGQTPVDLAREYNHKKISQIFQQYQSSNNELGDLILTDSNDQPITSTFFLPESDSSDGYQTSLSSNMNSPSQEDLAIPETTEQDLSWVLERRWDNAGTPGTKIYPKTALTKFFVVSSVFITLIYITWRACRTINPDHVGYSVFIYVCELFLTLQFLLSLVLMWAPITRPDKDLYKMVGESEFPTVDIYVVTYNEDEEIVDATVCAAANLSYPKKKIHIFVLDDGKRANIKAMSERIQSELESIGSRVKITYCARPKVKGVNHHAKAGNINHCFTKLP